MKIVVLGSCRFEPYNVIIVPEKVEGKWNTEEGYQIAFQKFSKAIKACDVVWVWCPDGIGEHTRRDAEFAIKEGKQVFLLLPQTKALLEQLDKTRIQTVEELLKT